MAAADRPTEITAPKLAALLGISQRAVLDLAARDVLKRGQSRGGYLLGPSIQSYCAHLRNLAQGMGGEAAIAEAAKQRARGSGCPPTKRHCCYTVLEASTSLRVPALGT